MNKASKILENSLAHNLTWLSGERSYEISRLETLLRGSLNEEERSIAASMLQFYKEESR
jgi:hypothetical protein